MVGFPGNESRNIEQKPLELLSRRAGSKLAFDAAKGDHKMRTRSGDRAELLLASSIPDLKLDLVVVDHDRAAAELYTNGQIMLCLESVVCETQQKARLSDG